MSKNLGSLFFLLFYVHILCASSYVWEGSANKTQAYINEAIYLKYVCRFSDKSELYTIDFNPKQKGAQIELLKESEQIIDDKRVNTYEFVAFVKEAQAFVFDFDVTMKHTTQESIDSTIGGRDNDREKEQFVTQKIHLKPLSVNIKNAPTALVGSFSLQVKKDTQSISAYEPYHLEILIEGKGNFAEIKPFVFKIEGVKVFSEAPDQELHLTKDGYVGRWTQKFAFVSDTNFTISSIALSYFDPKRKKVQTLSTPKIELVVKKRFEKEELLDIVEQEQTPTFSYEYVYYFLTFFAGFLVAKIKFKKEKTEDTKEKNFQEKLKDVDSLQELAVVLTLQDAKKYEALIRQIETKQIRSLALAKKKGWLINQPLNTI